MNTPQSPTPDSTTKLRWYQFSLRALLIGVTALSVLCGIATYIGWRFIWDAVSSTLWSIGGYIGWQLPVAILILILIGCVIAKARSVELVRLLSAVVIAFSSCWFVVQYDSFAEIRFGFDHPGGNARMNTLCQLIGSHAKQVYVIPVLGLVLGLLRLWRWPQSKHLAEVVVQLLWIFAVLWTGNVLLTWEMANIPIFTAMHWHY